MRSDDQLPDVGQAIAGVLQSVPAARRALLIALAERLAAARYRRWADEVGDNRRAGLLECAKREEEIARRIETLYPNAASEQSAFLARHPELSEINESLFAGRPLAQQFTIQARGERLGALTWRSFAEQAASAEARLTFLSCAPLEEESAVFLESLLRCGGSPPR